jgi:hypothetical protein
MERRGVEDGLIPLYCTISTHTSDGEGVLGARRAHQHARAHEESEGERERERVRGRERERSRALRARDLDDGRVHEAAPAKLVHDEKDAVG